MFRALYVISFLLLVFTGLLVACKTAPKNTDKIYSLEKKIKTGDRYHFGVNSETITIMELPETDYKNMNNSQIGFLYEVIQDSAGELLIKVSYDKFNATIEAQGVKKTYEANSTSFDPIERITGKLLNQPITVHISGSGELKVVSGYQELVKNIFAELNIKDDVAGKEIKNRISEMLGDNFVRSNLQEAANFFKDTSRYVGESWNVAQTNSTNLQLNSSTTYTLTSVEENIAEIEGTSTLSTNDASPTFLNSGRAAHLKGDGEEIFKIDLATGMPVSGKTKVTLKGTVQASAKEIPVQISISKKFTVKRL